MKIALLSDLHDGDAGPLMQRRGDIALVLLLRAIRRLDDEIRPDITLVLGDLLDDGLSWEAARRRRRLCRILDDLAAPYIVIPGNHDGGLEEFYQDFPFPGRSVAVNGVLFLPFIDREEPDCNASRSSEDIARFREARRDFEGPIVALQHVCLAPSGDARVPYNYTNADAIISAMQESRVALSCSGHYHAGAEPFQVGDTTFLHAPALCEAPFQFLIAELNGHEVTTSGVALGV